MNNLGLSYFAGQHYFKGRDILENA